MNEELYAAVGIVLGLIPFFVRRFVKRGDSENEHIKRSLENHRDALVEHRRLIENLNTRLEFREGVYGPSPLTSPGSPPSPALATLQAEYKSKGIK